MIISQASILTDSEIDFTHIADNDLVAALAGSHRNQAFEEIVRRHGMVVMGVCLRRLLARDDAEDAFQATFLVLLKKHETIRRTHSLKSWLFGTAWRISHKLALSRQRTSIDHGEHSPLSREASPFELLEQRYALQILDEELNSLTPQYRDPLIATYLESKTNDQIAAELGVTAGVIAGRLRRGKNLLRRRLLKRGLDMFGVVILLHSFQSYCQVQAAQSISTLTSKSLSFATTVPTTQLTTAVQILAKQELRKMPALLSYKTAVISAALAVPLALSIIPGPIESRSNLSTINTAVAGTPEIAFTQIASIGSVGNLSTSSKPSGSAEIVFFDRSPAVVRIETALTEETDVEFVDTPFIDAIKFLEDRHGIAMLIEKNALSGEGIPIDEPVSLVLKGVSLESIVNRMLKPLGLTYTIEDELLIVTTQTAANEKFETRVYNLTDFGFRSESELRRIADTLASLPDYEDQFASGNRISIHPNCLVISAPYHFHKEADKLLKRLRTIPSEDFQMDEYVPRGSNTPKHPPVE